MSPMRVLVVLYEATNIGTVRYGTSSYDTVKYEYEYQTVPTRPGQATTSKDYARLGDTAWGGTVVRTSASSRPGRIRGSISPRHL
eukprot:scaffold295521_cov40-Prasinocladus_malaysianus.AAC.1